MTIGPLSKQTGCNIETIRYYERIGIMPPPPRTEGGHRVYREEHLKRLEEAARRDHRKLGVELDLFSIHEEAGPGLVHWHPK